MGVNAKDTLSRAIGSAVRSIYRVTIVKRALDEGLAFLQAYAHGNPDDPENQELLQEEDLQHVQHFGFKSSPPADTEAIAADPDGGECTIAENDSLEDLDTWADPPTADTMPDLASGDTCIYSQDGTYIFLDSSGKLTIKAMTDNVEIITEAGKQIKLGQDGATYRDIAYAHTTEDGASKVASGAAMNTYSHNVYDDITAIKADLDELRGKMVQNQATITCINANAASTASVGGTPTNLICGNPAAVGAITLVPNTTDGINTDVDHSYVSSGSTKAEVEP